MNGTHEANDSPRQQTLFPTEYARTPTPPAPPANWSKTSQDAAESIRNAAPTLRMQCLAAIAKAGSRGLTRHEVAAATSIDLATVCPRCRELIRLGLVIEHGERPSPKNRAAGVLIATNNRKESQC